MLSRTVKQLLYILSSTKIEQTINHLILKNFTNTNKVKILSNKLKMNFIGRYECYFKKKYTYKDL